MGKETQIIDRDLGMKEILSELSEASSMRVKIGIQGKDAIAAKEYFNGKGAKEKSSTATLAEVASAHEFGCESRHIPERSFLRSAIDANRRNLELTQARLISLILARKLTAKNALGLLGQQVEAFVDDQFSRGGEPKWVPLKLASRKRKSRMLRGARKAANIEGADIGPGGEVHRRGDVPLNDTGQLRNSITSLVVEE